MIFSRSHRTRFNGFDARFRAASELVNRGFYKTLLENATSGYVGVIGMRHGSIYLISFIWMDSGFHLYQRHHPYVILPLADNFSKN